MLLKTVLFVVATVVVCEAGPVDFYEKTKSTTRIVGGNQTTIEKHPYQLSLLRNNSADCGAVIIGPQWALTAAHCVVSMQVSQISFRAGSTSKLNGGTIHKAVKIISHSLYNSTTYDYDIAVVKVNTSFPIGSNRVKAINLAASGFVVPDNSPAIVSGWGVRSTGGAAIFLHEVSVNIINRKKCQNQYSQQSITMRMICAGVESGGKDSCQGDSGGPLVYKNNTLIGIVSWGYYCGQPGYPGVYTNVENLRQWIKNNTGI